MSTINKRERRKISTNITFYHLMGIEIIGFDIKSIE
jgi:hypothetical protein